MLYRERLDGEGAARIETSGDERWRNKCFAADVHPRARLAPYVQRVRAGAAIALCAHAAADGYPRPLHAQRIDLEDVTLPGHHAEIDPQLPGWDGPQRT